MEFAYPNILIGLLALAIPIIIHLLQISRPRQVYYTRFALLRRSDSKSKSARKLRDILILICRVAALAAIVIAFAQPYIPGKAKLEDGQALLSTFLIDNTQSMFETNGTQKIYDAAIELVKNAESIIPTQTPRLFFDAQVHIDDKKELSHEAFLARCDAYVEPQPGLDFKLSIKKVLRFLQERHSNKKKVLFIASDFQNMDAIEYENIPNNTVIYLLPLHNTQKSNVYVDSLWLEYLLLRPGEKNVLQIKVRQSGNVKSMNTSVKLYLNGALSGSQVVNLEIGESKILSFEFDVHQRKPLQGVVKLEDEGMQFDNNYYFQINIPQKVNIGIIEEQVGFIHKALKSEDFFQIDAIKPNAINETFLKKCDFLIVENCNLISESGIEWIKNQVRNGMKMLLVPGENQNSALLKKILGPEMEVIAKPEVKDIHLYSLKPWDERNPFLKGVFERLDKKTRLPWAVPSFQLHGAGTVILENKMDQHVLIKVSQGKGSIYVFTMPFMSDKTNLHLDALFIPLTYNMLFKESLNVPELAYRPGKGLIELTFSEPLDPATIFSIRGPSGQSEIPEQFIDGKKWIGKLPSTIKQSGYYTLQASNVSDAPVVAINYKKDESVLKFATKDALKEMHKNQTNIKLYDAEVEQDFAAQVKNENFATPFWRWFIGIAILCFCMEVLLLLFLNPALKI